MTTIRRVGARTHVSKTEPPQVPVLPQTWVPLACPVVPARPSRAETRRASPAAKWAGVVVVMAIAVSVRADTLPPDPAEWVNLTRWGHPAEIEHGPIIVTRRGELLPVEGLALQGDRLRAQSPTLGPMQLSRAALARIAFSPEAAERLPAAREDAAEHDSVVLNNGDRIRGHVATVEHAQGQRTSMVGVMAGDRLTEVPSDRVASIDLSSRQNARQRMPVTELGLWIGLRDGTLIRATSVEQDGDKLTINAPALEQLVADREAIVFIQPVGGRRVYLSDREPDGSTQVPYLSLAWPYRRDRCVSGEWLRAGGHRYLKGLGVHSAARLTYRLDETFVRFEAEIAIDDVTAGRGSVRFRVFVDGEERLTSEPIRGGERPVPIRVDLDGAERLDLIVDYAERAAVLDRADWLDARLISRDI